MTMALSVLALASCSSKYEYDGAGQWNANEGYAQAQFSKTSITVELAPTDPTQTTIELKRLNTTGSAVVNFDIETNTDNVFTVSPTTFADGEETATAVVSFPNAEVGKQYTLKLAITDPNVVSQYSASNGCTLNVMRVKWNDAGFIYTDETKTKKKEGYAMYTDDFVSTFFNTGTPTFVTKLQERDDKPGYFRMVNTYHENYPYNEPGDWDDTKDYYIYIDATDTKKVFIPHYCTQGTDWSYGNFLFSSMAGYYLAKDDEETAAPYYGTYENGAITFPKDALLFGMSNYKSGAFYGANSSGAFKLVIDPDKALYTAQISDYVFSTDGLIFEGQFTSEKLGTEEEGIMLIKGAADESIEAANKGCYSRFEAKYGAPYMIVSPYASGYHILFCVNADGKVIIPDEIANQPIGLDAMGDDVYAHINGGASSFSESEIVLNITFQNEAGDVVYGETNETLANIKWNLVGTGTYTYSIYYEGSDDGYEIYQREDKPNMYKVSNWCDGSDFIFTWNQETNKCTVPITFTGIVHSQIGNIYVGDVPTFYYALTGKSVSYDDYPCTYDPDSKTFSFNLYYLTLEGQGWGPGVETLKVDWNSTSSSKRASSIGKVKRTNAKKIVLSAAKSRFVGKKVNPKKYAKTLQPTSKALFSAE